VKWIPLDLEYSPKMFSRVGNVAGGRGVEASLRRNAGSSTFSRSGT
jgi:hypothetical protein